MISNDQLENWENLFIKEVSKHESDDGSHDLGHFKRVWKMAKSFASEDDDLLVILAASYFHDIVNYPKNSPLRSKSSSHAAEKAAEILTRLDFPSEKIENVKHCIEAHSFSANIETKTSEAKIVQDADRMETLGAIGLARVFYVSGRMGSKLFHGEDPFAENRERDDRAFALDHFETKILKLPKTMKTIKGKEEAIKRTKIILDFLNEIKYELTLT